MALLLFEIILIPLLFILANFFLHIYFSSKYIKIYKVFLSYQKAKHVFVNEQEMKSQ